MPRINIVEKDQTLTTSTEQLYNVVYVPGFSLSSNDKMPPKTPITFTSYSRFLAIVGNTPATFAKEVKYDDCGSFSANAKTSDGILFSEGQADPSYLYAAELLKQGIPVVYEKVNESASEVVATLGKTLTSVPTGNEPAEGWSTEDLEKVGFTVNEITYSCCVNCTF